MFTNLPLELLQGITSHLNLHNRLKLRTVFKKQQEDVVVDLLGGAMKTLHVSLTDRSILHFEKITNADFFSKQIDTIAYLPYVLPHVIRDEDPEQWDGWEKIQERTFEDYRQSGCVKEAELTLKEVRRSYATYRDIREQHIAFPNYSHHALDSMLMASLEHGLSRLQNLRKLEVVSSIQTEGLNASSLVYNIPLSNYGFVLEDESALDKVDQVALARVRSEWWHDRLMPRTDVVLRAIKKASVQIRELRIGGTSFEELVDCSLAFFHGMTKYSSGAREILLQVTDLTIGVYDIDEGDGEGAGEEPVPQPKARDWRMIAECTTMLKRLTLVVSSERYTRDWDPLDSPKQPICYFLEVNNYRHLQSLHLNADHHCLASVDSGLLLDFLRDQNTSAVLREVKLSDIITLRLPKEGTLCENRAAQGAMLTDGIRSFLEGLSELTFDVFEMKIEHRDQEGQYTIDWSLGWGNDEPQVTWFEELASELNVRLSEDGWKDGKKGWNFGEAIAQAETNISAEG